ncbi:MAG TPA: tRNA 2-selenouridine(34) synthase MnmH [Puia sp.]|nr:tRNA 2-selenouridine(34) synthase MnmH [Puia sp.]
MTHRITISEWMKQPDLIPVVDVRTPAEFIQGHMPGAFNLPLFTDEERVQVGTTYKQAGKEAAILLGFDLTGTKWAGFIRQALEIAPSKKITLHCWRGGMRSGAMAWALDLYGFDVWLIEGGYKSYRRWVSRQFEQSYQLQVIGGMTGSGKTRTLHRLSALGEQAIDLEGLARHCGSTYGTLNRLVQPSQEQFENELAAQLYQLDRNRRIWIEDESITIGKRLIPRPIWNQMQTAYLFDLQVPPDQRIQALVREYGLLDIEFLVECTERIHKRLGTERTKHAIAAIRESNMGEFIRLVLVYYDKAYRTGLNSRDAKRIISLPVRDSDPVHNAGQLLTIAQTLPAATPNITV